MAAQTESLSSRGLDDASKTKPLAHSDLAALRTVADSNKVSWPSLTRISAARARRPFVPEALDGRRFGSLLTHRRPQCGRCGPAHKRIQDAAPATTLSWRGR